MGFFEKLFGKKQQLPPEYYQDQYMPEEQDQGYPQGQQPYPPQGQQPYPPQGQQYPPHGQPQPYESDGQNTETGGWQPGAEEKTEHTPTEKVASHPEFEAFEKQSYVPVQPGTVTHHTGNTERHDEVSAKKWNEASREVYIGKYRAEFKHHFPASLDTVESHMQLPYMIGSVVDVSPVIEYATNNVYDRFREEPEKLAELSRAAVAKVAMFLEKFIEAQEQGYFEAALVRAHGESLEKAWIVLDFYCRMLKAEYTGNISALHGLVTDELVKRSTNPVVQARSESYEDVLAKCAKVISEDADSNEIPELKKRLFEKLLELDSIFVIHDDTFNSAFPYIGADGRLEIQTNGDRAAALKSFLEKNGDSKVSINEYKKEQYEEFFTKILHLGLTVIRLDNGLTPVEIDINGIFDDGEKNLIEVCNRYARSRFISELQYGYRIKNLLGDKRDTEDYRVLSAAMISARSDGYRALAGGLVYVFNIGGENKGATLYTPKALENASEIMKVMGVIDESTLIAPGDTSFETFSGETALRTISRKDAAPDKGFVCAFTDRENAEKIRRRFAEAGANDAVLVMTLGELCASCRDCAGFILDMSSYGLEVPKELFGKISEIARTSGIIVGGKEIEL